MTSKSILMGVNGPRKALATPAVRAESRELGINLADVAGTYVERCKTIWLHRGPDIVALFNSTITMQYN